MHLLQKKIKENLIDFCMKKILKMIEWNGEENLIIDQLIFEGKSFVRWLTYYMTCM